MINNNPVNVFLVIKLKTIQEKKDFLKKFGSFKGRVILVGSEVI